MRHPAGIYSNYAAVLNLEVEREYAGWDISLEAQGIASLRNKHTNREGISANGTWTFAQYNVYATLDASSSEVFEAASYDRRYWGYYRIVTSPISLSAPNIRNKRLGGMMNVGVDCNMSKRNTLSLQTRVDLGNSVKRDSYNATIEDGGATQQNQLTNAEDYLTVGYAVSASYRGQPFPRVGIQSDVLYNHYRVRENHRYTSDDLLSENRAEGSKDYIQQSFELTYRLAAAWSLSVSNVFAWRHYKSMRNEVAMPIYFSENIRNRALASIRYSLGRHFAISGGGVVQTNYERNGQTRRPRNRILPCAKLFWHPLMRLNVSLNYFNSVDYPVLDQLSPIVWQRGCYLTIQGNPHLQPKLMHYAELQVELERWCKLTAMHKWARNDISEYYERIGSRAFTLKPQNTNVSHSYLGAEGNYTLARSIRLSVLLNYQWYTRYRRATPKRHGYSYTVETNISYEISPLSLQLMMSYYLRYDLHPLLQGEEYAQQEQMVVGVSKMLFHDRLSMEVMMSIPTQAILKETYQRIETAGFQSTVRGDGRINSFALFLRLRVLLGNKKSRRSTSDISVEQEKAS